MRSPDKNENVVRVLVAPGTSLPEYCSEKAAGADIHAYLDAPLTLMPGAWMAIPTGLVLEIPDGYEGQVRPRSGLALKYGVSCLNSPGTIDSDYRGEVKVILINHGNEPFVLNPGERIAQLVIAPCRQVHFESVTTLNSTNRGDGGFGSTGR